MEKKKTAKQRAKPRKKPNAPPLDLRQKNGKDLIAESEIIAALEISNGFLSVAAKNLKISTRQLKKYVDEKYKQGCAQVLEEIRIKNTDILESLVYKLVRNMLFRADLEYALMNQRDKEGKLKPDFDNLSTVQFKEQSFFTFLLKVLAKDRGYSELYNPADFAPPEEARPEKSPEEIQIMQIGYKEIERRKPELFSVIKGGKKG